MQTGARELKVSPKCWNHVSYKEDEEHQVLGKDDKPERKKFHKVQDVVMDELLLKATGMRFQGRRKHSDLKKLVNVSVA